MIVLTKETKENFSIPIVWVLKDTSLLDQLMVRFGIDQKTVSDVADKTVASCYKDKNILLEKGDVIELDFYNSVDDFVPKDICLKEVGYAMAKVTKMNLDTNKSYVEIYYELEIIQLTVSEEG